MLQEGRDVVLEIDVQGAAQIRDADPDAVLILIEPPSFEELARRLRDRGTEDEATIERRLRTARTELEQATWFDHVVVNDDLERASAEVAAIIEYSRAERGKST
jgi:guanylate kinase